MPACKEKFPNLGPGLVLLSLEHSRFQFSSVEEIAHTSGVLHINADKKKKLTFTHCLLLV